MLRQSFSWSHPPRRQSLSAGFRAFRQSPPDWSKAVFLKFVAIRMNVFRLCGTLKAIRVAARHNPLSVVTGGAVAETYLHRSRSAPAGNRAIYLVIVRCIMISTALARSWATSALMPREGLRSGLSTVRPRCSPAQPFEIFSPRHPGHAGSSKAPPHAAPDRVSRRPLAFMAVLKEHQLDPVHRPWPSIRASESAR